MNYRKIVVDILLSRDGQHCKICNRIFTPADPPTVDHLIPQTVNGPDNIDNLQLLHWDCNANKGTQPFPRRRPQAITDKESVLEILTIHHGDKFKAAKQLHVSVRTLYRWLK